MSNLIQNYISSKSPAASVNVRQEVKPKPDFDIRSELNNRTFIKPLNGRGKLVSTNIFMSPKHKFDNIVYNLNAISHAAQGKANDHELGKINDVGLVTGGLAIASYLAAKRTTPMTKGMEFVGLGTFLASMALWPVLAIQLPAYLIHGVNVHKKYTDSFGRVKPFYQDPQFIPWDLYSDKEIDKIGDRMGVSKNIKNRRDFIQEKMRKLAVQNNTLWMLTAGFATPVMSALMCNYSEPYLNKFLSSRRNAKADKILEDLTAASKKYQTHDIENGLKLLARQYNDKPIDSKFIDKVSEIFTSDIDFVTSESLKKDLEKFLSDGKFSLNDKAVENISGNLKEIFEAKNFSKEFIDQVLPDAKTLTETLTEKNLIGKNFRRPEFQNISVAIADLITENAKNFNTANPEMQEDIQYIRTLINSATTENNPIIKEILKNPSNIFDATGQAKLNNIAKIFDDFIAKDKALDEYVGLKVGASQETIIANYCNETQTEFLKAMGITQKDLEKARFDKDLIGKLLRERFETIVSDKNTYENVLKKLVAQVATFDSKIKSSDITSHLLKGDTTSTLYEQSVDTLLDEYSRALNSRGFNRTASSLTGVLGNPSGSYKEIRKAYAQERVLGVKSSFYRFISTLDFYRRAVATPEGFTTYNILPRESMEELIELCKTIGLSGHSSDYAIKFYMKRNPHPADDYSKVEVENGRVKYKYFGKAEGTADIAGDKFFYQNGMKLLHGDSLHPETQAIINESTSIKEEIQNYRRLMFEKIGGEHYFFKPRHKVSRDASAGSDIKFLLVGMSPEEMIFKRGQQVFNTKKWLSIFGKFGAGLFAATVLAQFFLGKLKAPKGGRNA